MLDIFLYQWTKTLNSICEKCSKCWLYIYNQNQLSHATQTNIIPSINTFFGTSLVGFRSSAMKVRPLCGMDICLNCLSTCTIECPFKLVHCTLFPSTFLMRNLSFVSNWKWGDVAITEENVEAQGNEKTFKWPNRVKPRPQWQGQELQNFSNMLWSVVTKEQYRRWCWSGRCLVGPLY